MLVFATGAHFFGSMLGMATEQEIWVRHYAGDFGRNAQTQATLQSLSGGISFAINPLVAAWTDAYGRRGMMLFAQLMSLLRCILSVRRPTVSSMVVGDLTRSITMSTWFIASQASVGDLYKDDLATFSRVQSFVQMMPPAMSIVCPLMGASLAKVDLRLPFLVGAAIYLGTMVASVCALPETCAAKDRVRFNWRVSNPTSFLKLFCRGAQLRSLAAVEALSSMVDGRATFSIGMLQRQQLLGWEMTERTRFMSYASAIYVRVLSRRP